MVAQSVDMNFIIVSILLREDFMKKGRKFHTTVNLAQGLSNQERRREDYWDWSKMDVSNWSIGSKLKL